MADARRDPLFFFASSAFHAALFLLVVVAVFFRGGSLGFEVTGSSFVGGVLTYGLLMLGTLVGTRVGMTRLRTSLYDATAGEVVLAGLAAGGTAALIFTGGLALYTTAQFMIFAGANPVLALLYVGWYVLLATVIGSVIGLIAIVIDFAIVLLVRLILSPEDGHHPERQYTGEHDG